jgi:hypothetical protein
MQKVRIPRDVAATIKRCWPDGVVHQFVEDESYFQAMHARVERDFRKIRGASLLWQTLDEEASKGDGSTDEPATDEWQSYYVFFLAPHGDAFHVEGETVAIEESAETEEDVGQGGWTEPTSPGEEWIGCAVGISLAARYAVNNLDRYARYEDGTTRTPDVESFIYSDTLRDRIETIQYYREILSPVAFQTLTTLSDRIASVLAKHRIRVLDESVLNVRVPDLKASQEVFLEEPLRVRDALFFRGI